MRCLYVKCCFVIYFLYLCCVLNPFQLSVIVFCLSFFCIILNHHFMNSHSFRPTLFTYPLRYLNGLRVICSILLACSRKKLYKSMRTILKRFLCIHYSALDLSDFWGFYYPYFPKVYYLLLNFQFLFPFPLYSLTLGLYDKDDHSIPRESPLESAVCFGSAGGNWFLASFMRNLPIFCVETKENLKVSLLFHFCCIVFSFLKIF